MLKSRKGVWQPFKDPENGDGSYVRILTTGIAGIFNFQKGDCSHFENRK